MKAANKYVISILATGFVVLTLLSIGLFWGRKTCQAVMYEELIVGRCGKVMISPSGLVPELDDDPNAVRKSRIDAYIGDAAVYYGLSLLTDLHPALNDLLDSAFYYLAKDPETEKVTRHLLYFDKDSGLFAYCDVFRKPQQEVWSKAVRFYAGPKGVSETAGKALGRFTDVLVPRRPYARRHLPSLFILFDHRLHRFFAIDLEQLTVTKGPDLPKDYRPVQINSYGLSKNDGILDIDWRPPYRQETPQEQKEAEDRESRRRSADLRHFGTYEAGGGPQRSACLVPMVKVTGSNALGPNMLVLDESGEVKLLDTETLELVRTLGRVPVPPGQSRTDSRSRLSGLYAYEAYPVGVEFGHAGTICGSVSREGFSIRVDVFDPNGRSLISEGDDIEDAFERAGGPLLVTITYILENLQPAVLGLISCLADSPFEATAGHRALFILPNSFVALLVRTSGEQNFGLRLLLALVIISPSIVFGLLLAWRVHGNAVVVGLSHRARFWWVLGTIAFGLSAYITYRLTRPKITPVTCINCGRLRRPDMETCHRCGAAWEIPELTPPAWRVIAEQPQEGEPATANTQ
jgi:hypothetical protein